MRRYLKNTPLDEALSSYIDYLKKMLTVSKTEEIPVQESLGRVTSEAVYAVISSPHYYASAMDGIAVKAETTFHATETTPLTLIKDRDYEVVDTGDPIPEGYDAVIMEEDAVSSGEGVIIHRAATPFQHIRQIGEDICAGEMLLTSNIKITPAMIAALLAGGITQVKVYARPVVGILPTGDEIIAPGVLPEKGQIIESNSFLFSAMIKEWGAEPRVYPIARDVREILKESVLRACSECDMVLINAGSSAGRDDYAPDIVGELGTLFLHGLAIKPGKPAFLGLVSGKPVIGIPGYPVSGVIVMEQVVSKVLALMMQRGTVTENPIINASLSRNVVSSLKYREFVRTRLGVVDGKWVATPVQGGAGVITSLVKSDGIFEVEQNSEGLEAGTDVSVYLRKSPEELSRAFFIIGSHDPLIDELSDLVRLRNPRFSIASTHVGSMGGILALKRGEAHCIGTHLLDPQTGEYNIPYLKKYLKGDFAVIRAVDRIQGFIVERGNPLGITDIENIKKPNLRYVNRQKGSGTRVLLDDLLARKNINNRDIYGYEREEFTHLSVAVQIASGGADCGMGIYSAAKAYGLDFVPICTERYDFVIPARFLEDERTKVFMEALKSKEFRERLEKLGGYTVDEPGTVELLRF